VIKFSVEGTPIQQGSMKFIRPGVMIHSRAEDLAVWRANIASAAKLAGCKPIAEPISISMKFRVKRPKSVKRPYPTVSPDLDKYVRAVNDGLTGTAFEDDAQIVHIVASKVYADQPGVDIEISDEFDCL
jgi:Holliday junction resolvase RusA-like endonuclease